MNILFVCSRNKWRSPTAERIFCNRKGIAVRSAGLSPQSQRKLRESDLSWAEVVFAMEKEHKRRILEMVRKGGISRPEIVVLDIPDEYTFMDPELIEILEAKVIPYLNEFE